MFFCELCLFELFSSESYCYYSLIFSAFFQNIFVFEVLAAFCKLDRTAIKTPGTTQQYTQIWLFSRKPAVRLGLYLCEQRENSKSTTPKVPVCSIYPIHSPGKNVENTALCDVLVHHTVKHANIHSVFAQSLKALANMKTQNTANSSKV